MGLPHEHLPQFSTLTAFDYQSRTRVVFGLNSSERAGELARGLSSGKVLLVTDAGIVKAGHADRLRGIIESAGLKVVLFDKVAENPTTGCVNDCVGAAKKAGIDLIVALGGGSSLDTAKG